MSDTSARGFQSRGKRTFFNIKVFYPKTQGHRNKTLRKFCEINEHRKKRENATREVMQYILRQSTVRQKQLIIISVPYLLKNLGNWFHVSLKKN